MPAEHGLPASFTTNFQVYSFVLADSAVDPHFNGSYREFAAHLDEIESVQCSITADRWLEDYDPDTENAFFIDDIKFVRLVAVSPSASRK